MNDGFVPGVVMTALLFFVILGFLRSGLDDSWRHQIADHGCAEFYLDQNNERQWNWKSCQHHDAIKLEPLEDKK